MIDRINNVSFGARLYTNLDIPQAKAFMKAARGFEWKTKAKYPDSTLYLQSDRFHKERTVLTIGGEKEWTNYMDIDVLQPGELKDSSKLASKLVKVFKMLTLEEDILRNLGKDREVVDAIAKMNKIAGNDAKLQEYAGNVRRGYGYDNVPVEV